jgi:hypothetical protein
MSVKYALLGELLSVSSSCFPFLLCSGVWCIHFDAKVDVLPTPTSEACKAPEHFKLRNYLG